jgi:hypothetical protein
MSVLEKLTEGIVDRNLKQESNALLEKWERTGLLEGISNENSRNTMSRLLENQAAQLLKEASSMAAGDVQGFASVAFPIVRRVFGGLIANDLVAVQPMSLPSGLIFFLDFTHTDTRLEYNSDGTVDSLYGGGVVGSQITGGVSSLQEDEGGFYNLNNGYTSPVTESTVAITKWATGTACGGVDAGGPSQADWDTYTRHDPDLSGSLVAVGIVNVPAAMNKSNLVTFTVSGSGVTSMTSQVGRLGVPANAIEAAGRQVRRLTQFSGSATEKLFVMSVATGSEVAGGLLAALTGTTTAQFTTSDTFENVGDSGLGAVVGAASWLLESDGTTVSGEFGDKTGDIPEIDIKVDSVSVTAITKKLKAKWTPELGQDLNAYHNLDAEVELTSILSEQIALEIDREILNDLVSGATAGTYHWSRQPGTFVKRDTGELITNTVAQGPDFTGTVSEWYETLVETINDLSAQIHRKTLRGGANFLVVSPEVANILEFTAGFRANVTADQDKGTVGAIKVGSMSKKWDVWVDPYFLRNVVLVGRRGSNFLESGYVYAPYVPLQVTPTIFGTEDFIPRKGVMTRYAKKMVRPDMYGLVIVTELLG